MNNESACALSLLRPSSLLVVEESRLLLQPAATIPGSISNLLLALRGEEEDIVSLVKGPGIERRRVSSDMKYKKCM